MDQAARLAIFQAQTTNVRALTSAMRQVHRSINVGLRSNDQAAIASFTKVYAILFCGWAEANFSKIIHTPYGFELPEIAQIQETKRESIVAAWKKAVELGLRHLDAKRGSFRPNAQRRLEAAIDAHVFDPSLLRNKLAHGQWVSALNRDNDAIQIDLTKKLSELDVVKIMAWKKSHEALAQLVETLIESPKKAFMRDWYGVVEQLEADIREAEQRTIADHVLRLKAKDTRGGAKKKKIRTAPRRAK